MKQADEYPNDPKLDEVYYNAAVNFEQRQAHRLGDPGARDALRRPSRTRRWRRRPSIRSAATSRTSPRTTRRPSTTSSSPRSIPGEKDAPIALNTASFFRRGLGENDKAIKDTELFVKNYGGRHEFVDKAAGVDFDEGQIYEQRKDYAQAA